MRYTYFGKKNERKMKRWAIKDLESWKKHPRRKPLLLLGARQVGKTWLMHEFGRLHYKDVVYVRFDKDVYMRQAFEQDYDIPRLMNTLRIHSGLPVTPGETLIILDEIQECPCALTSLKYFCEDVPEQHIIAAGSLLGLEEHTGTGFPVGKVDRVYLYPMCYTEFLEACGYGRYVELLRSRDWGMIRTFQPKFEELLRYYYYVGGMPAAVQEYANSRDMAAVRSVQDNLLADYRGDFRKHATAEETHLIAQIWKTLPEQLAREDKRFVHSAVGAEVKAARLRGPIRWLQDAGLVNPVYRVRKPEIPLEAYAEPAFKMFMVDVGLLAAKSKLPAAVILEQNNIFKQYKGALTEQYVQQQLLAEARVEPFYWAAERAQAEVDFLLQMDVGTVPVEVKAERNLRAKSLQSFCKRFGNKLAVRTSMSSYAVSTAQLPAGKSLPQGLEYMVLDLPLFAICCLSDEVSALYSRL